MSVCGRLGWVLLLSAAVARADGAFPDSLGILLPRQSPHLFYVSTNFGLLLSQNGGADWHWVCEEVTGVNAWQYTLGAEPQNILYAVSQDGIRRSADGACRWFDAQTSFAYGTPFDVFPAPAEALRAVGLGRHPPEDGGLFPYAAYQSVNGGESFSQRLWLAPSGLVPSGIEISRSDPERMVMTVGSTAEDGGFYLYHSPDRGQSWSPQPLLGLEAERVLLVAIDRARPERVFLRVIGANGEERLMVTEGNGGVVRSALTLPDRMTAFVQRDNGDLWVAGSTGGLWRSQDDGQNFAHLEGPHVHGLAEREGVLYAATDNLADGFAVAQSADGTRWEPMLRYADIRGPLSCGEVAEACQVPWVLMKDRLGVVTPSLPAEKPTPQRCGCGATSGWPWLVVWVGSAMRWGRRRSGWRT